MSEPIQAAPVATSNKPPAAEANGQLIVALAIVISIAVIAVGIMIVMAVTKDSTLGVGLGTALGILGTALNAPTGIGNVIRGAMATKKEVEQ